MARSAELSEHRVSRREWWLAVALLMVAVACEVTAGTLILAAPVDPARASIGPGEGTAFALAWAAFPVVGTIIIRRRPGNVIGWLCVLGGLHNGIVAVVTAIATANLAADPGSSTGIAFGWLSHTLVTTLIIVPLLIMMRFPTGRPLGQRWQWAERLALVIILAVALVLAVEPMPLFSFPATPNPLGLGSPRLMALAPGIILVWVFPVGAATAALLVRYRRGSPIERRQIRWLAAASFLVALAAVTMPLTSPDVASGRMSTTSAVAFALGFWTIPASIGVAIVRYRLYEIDRLIKRTLVYAIVSGILVMAYIVAVVGLSAPLTTVLPAQGGTLTTAAATLLVAALFRPVRGRAQVAVDRRFDRERHEAGHLVDAFAGRMRSDVALDGIVRDLLGATTRTVHPSACGCWLRSRGPTERPLIGSLHER